MDDRSSWLKWDCGCHVLVGYYTNDPELAYCDTHAAAPALAARVQELEGALRILVERVDFDPVRNMDGVPSALQRAKQALANAALIAAASALAARVQEQDARIAEFEIALDMLWGWALQMELLNEHDTEMVELVKKALEDNDG